MVNSIAHRAKVTPSRLLGSDTGIIAASFPSRRVRSIHPARAALGESTPLEKVIPGGPARLTGKVAVSPSDPLIVRDRKPIIRDMASATYAREPQGRSQEPFTRIARTHLSALRGIPQVLESLGVAVDPILEAMGLGRADFEDPERSASFAELDQLIGLCLQHTKCAHFGLLVGRYVNLQSFGIIGRMARNAPSVGVALRDLSTYFSLHEIGGMPSVAIHAGSVVFAYGIHAPGVQHADQFYDLSLAAMSNVMRQLCGPDWLPDAILLPRKRPPDVRRYREILGAPLRFDSPQAAVLFRETWLSRPVVDADSLLHSLLKDRATAAITQQHPLLSDDVRRTIRQLLLARRCSRAEVARRIGLHPRTLGRRLKDGGTTFQALLDETRLQLARQLLHDTRAPVARIADSLGYRDPTVFTRAFRRWTGLTPRDFRASLPDRW
jgi:AraC-like DNA-binding protein